MTENKNNTLGKIKISREVINRRLKEADDIIKEWNLGVVRNGKVEPLTHGVR